MPSGRKYLSRHHKWRREMFAMHTNECSSPSIPLKNVVHQCCRHFLWKCKMHNICLCESIFVVTAAISQAGRQPLEGWDALRISSETSAFECCAEKYLHNVHKMHGRWWKWAPQLSHPTVEHLCHYFFFSFVNWLSFGAYAFSAVLHRPFRFCKYFVRAALELNKQKTLSGRILWKYWIRGWESCL